MRSNDFHSGGLEDDDTHREHAPAPFSHATAIDDATPLAGLPSPLFIHSRGHCAFDAQPDDAPASFPHSDGQAITDAQRLHAVASFSNGGGQATAGAHSCSAPATPSCDQGHGKSDTHFSPAEVAPLCEEGQTSCATQRDRKGVG